MEKDNTQIIQNGYDTANVYFYTIDDFYTTNKSSIQITGRAINIIRGNIGSFDIMGCDFSCFDIILTNLLTDISNINKNMIDMISYFNTAVLPIDEYKIKYTTMNRDIFYKAKFINDSDYIDLYSNKIYDADIFNRQYNMDLSQCLCVSNYKSRFELRKPISKECIFPNLDETHIWDIIEQYME